jgi:hypothetical protein
MPQEKFSPRQQGTRAPETVSSYIRTHDAQDVAVPAHAAPLGGESVARSFDPEAFLEDWVLRHFTVSVKLHDVERLSEGDPERKNVIDDLQLVQGILLELHDFASGEPRVQAMLSQGHVLQNGVSALYGWLDEVLDTASRLRVTRGKPSFIDAGEQSFITILRTLERVHPDLETLVQIDAMGVEEDVARKITLCFRQIGAAVVRVSGRTVSTYPPSP